MVVNGSEERSLFSLRRIRIVACIGVAFLVSGLNRVAMASASPRYGAQSDAICVRDRGHAQNW
jgi:hypothetical protein